MPIIDRKACFVPHANGFRSDIWQGRSASSLTVSKAGHSSPEPAEADQLPPLLKGFGAVPSLISDIDLSLDDRFLYVAC